LEEVVEEMVV